MRIPPKLSAHSLVTCLCRHWDYHFVGQVGKHIRLETTVPRFQRLTFPVQDELHEKLLESLLERVGNHKRIDVDKIVDTL